MKQITGGGSYDGGSAHYLLLLDLLALVFLFPFYCTLILWSSFTLTVSCRELWHLEFYFSLIREEGESGDSLLWSGRYGGLFILFYISPLFASHCPEHKVEVQRRTPSITRKLPKQRLQTKKSN